MSDLLNKIIAKLGWMIVSEDAHDAKADADEVNKMIKEANNTIDDIVAPRYAPPKPSGFKNIVKYSLAAILAVVTLGLSHAKAEAQQAQWYQDSDGKIVWYYPQGGGYGVTTDNKHIIGDQQTVTDLQGNQVGSQQILPKHRVGNPDMPRSTPEPVDYESLKRQAYAFEEKGDYRAAIDSLLSISPEAKSFAQRGEHNAAIQALINAMNAKGISRDEQAEDLWHFGRVYTAIELNMGKIMLKYARDNYKGTEGSAKATETITVHRLN